MNEYTFAITVTCETEDQAHQVIAERLDREESYGFDYTIEMPVMLGNLTKPVEDDDAVQNDRYRVRFRPQAWINGDATDVDRDGPVQWFIEEDSVGPAQWATEKGLDLDFLKFDPFAPQWIKDWTGPFEIELIID